MRADELAKEAPDPIDYLGALKLAVDAGAGIESSYRLMTTILDDSPDPPGSALWPTKLLIEAIQKLEATVTVP
jgi:hypothetical protein